jgi:prophage regulatory protein
VAETLKIIRGEKALYEKIGLRRTTIEELLSRGEFPKPVRIGKRAKGFLEHELDEWLRKRANERDQNASTTTIIQRKRLRSDA